MPENTSFLWTCDLLVSQKTTQRQIFSTLLPFSMVIFATATVLAFALLRDSRFNFHCYTQCEATPTQKSAPKCAKTSRNILRERLQSAFTLANQLRWIAQWKYHKLKSKNSKCSNDSCRKGFFTLQKDVCVGVGKGVTTSFSWVFWWVVGPQTAAKPASFYTQHSPEYCESPKCACIWGVHD